MKLSEISRIKSADQHSDLAVMPNIKNLDKLSWNFQGYELYGKSLPNNQFFLALQDNDKIVGWYVYRIISLYGQEYANTQRVVIEPEYRGKGLGTIFYYYLTRHLKKKILSDEYITGDGEKLMLTMIKKFNTSVIDITSGEITKYRDGDLDKVLTNKREPTDFRLIYENKYVMPPHDLNLCPEYKHIVEGF